MDACINTNSAEFRALKESSGLSEFQLKIAINSYLTEHGDVWPRLDELPHADSRQYLKEKLKIKDNGATKIQTILEQTKSDSIEEAVIKLNNTHRDLNITILPILDEAVVFTERRPSKYQIRVGLESDLSLVDSKIFIGLALLNLAENFGILTIFKTTEELRKEGILDRVPEGTFVSAFILEGNIIVNSDVASVDAPVHELMHVLLGSLKFTNPDLYYNIVSQARNLQSYNRIAELYQHRGQSDVDEEVFVEEYSKFLSGLPSEFNNLDKEAVYQLNYEMSRTLDTILNGDNSVSMIPEANRFGISLRNLGRMVNSKNMQPKCVSYADSAYISRVIGNMKEKLFKENKLEEIC